MSYTIEHVDNAIVVRGPVPVAEFSALAKIWRRQGFKELATGLAGPLGASFVLVKSQADYDAIAARIQRQAALSSNGDKVREWLLGTDTGLSSVTIVAVLGDEKTKGIAQGRLGSWRLTYPLDPSDFGRCHRLLEIVPEWRSRLGEVAAACPGWGALVEHWDELTALYLEELPMGRAPKLFDRMKALLKRAA